MFDFTPLYRSSIGFDHLARMLDEAATFETPSYPPYNIERVGEDEYLISVAIAGFTSDDVNIEVKGNDLTITGNPMARKNTCIRALPDATSSAPSSWPTTLKSKMPNSMKACCRSRSSASFQKR